MKKILVSGLLAGLFCFSACASDGGIYVDDTTTEARSYVVRRAPRQQHNVVSYRGCNTCDAQPVRVKTHTEVIDHYQVYQPVTVYVPSGSYSERRVCSACAH